MNERCKQRIEETFSRQADTDRIHNKGALEIRQNHAAAVARDTDSLNKLHQVIAVRTTSAFSGATSVPAPIATPTVASLKAGATIAQHRHNLATPRALGDFGRLLVREEIGVEMDDTAERESRTGVN